MGENRVNIEVLPQGHVCLGDRICAVEYRSAIVEHLRLRVEGTAYGVVQLIERVDVVVDFVKSLATGVVAETGGIGHVEVAVIVEYNFLLYKCLPLIRHCCTGREFGALHVLEPFSAPQGEHQVLFLRRSL